MIVINLPTAPQVHLPPEPEPVKREQQNTPSRSPSPAPGASRSDTPSTDSSAKSSKPTTRRSTPRVNSAAYARSRDTATPEGATRKPEPVSVAASSAQPQEDPRALKYEIPADIPIPAFGKPSKDIERDLGRLYEAVSGARRIAVICGAGISVSSPANIPDFRSANGLFKKLKEQHPTAGLSSGKDLFDARLFNSETTSSLFYSMVAELKRLADEAQPTIFHRLLKRLDEEGRLQRVYTQNIDGLEEKAGLTFGLGETGDSTSTVRALGKRKRQGAGANGPGGQSNWARSKSDSHLIFNRKQQTANPITEQTAGNPMFPRTIPLHGTLQTLTCALCSHKVSLSNTVHQEQVQQEKVVNKPELQSAMSHQESIEALQLLRQGEPVPCPKCKTSDEARVAGGLRSRGVGRMKVDIVLYGGQNEGAERVGECLQRDILGLRDPFEPPVPESAAETRARERKEKKEQEKRQKEQEMVAAAAAARVAALAASIAETEEEEQKPELPVDEDAKQVDNELGDTSISICDTDKDRDDVLAAAFAEDDHPAMKSEAASVSFAELPEVPSKQKRAPRPPRLKPLPPDLLIVAGTSLKVPGTKRIVREFAKACHARDYIVYYSDSDDEDGSEDGKTRSRSRSKSAEAEDEDDDDADAPIRTILFNYDFPNPSREWEEVFDVWVQGDLQRAALGIFPPRPVAEETEAIESVVAQYSWAGLKAALEEQRQLAKRKPRRSLAAAGRTVSMPVGAIKEGKGRGGAASRQAWCARTHSVAPPTPPHSDSSPEPAADESKKALRQTQITNLGKGIKPATAAARRPRKSLS